MNAAILDNYIAILEDELIPALGCTEPIAIAYAAAKARAVLGTLPEHIAAFCSGNIIKNVKGVTVPNSGGQRGVEVAATLGCIGGDASLGFEVLGSVCPQDIETTRRLVREGYCQTHLVEGKDNLYIRIEAQAGAQTSSVTIEHTHTNITRMEKDGKVLFSAETAPEAKAVDKSLLNVRDALEFAREVELSRIQPLMEKQLQYNTAISEEGLHGHYGAEIGKILMSIRGDSVEGRAAARAAAGSDARMNGCSMPVVINSGSGNQGLTVALPVAEFARAWNKSDEQLYRALAFSNLISIHIKRHIGSLSAFCGAVSAACGAACAIAYMDGCSYEQICMTITNMLCNVGGIVCDGAKSSCAAKIASAVEAGILAYNMSKRGKAFQFGEGIVGDDIEQTIQNIGRVGRVGMRSTDVEILHVMVGE